MKLAKRLSLPGALCVSGALLLGACAPGQNSNTNTANTATPATSPTQQLTQVERPQRIRDMQAQRGEQDQAEPTLRVIEPREGQTINGSTVHVRLELGGNLRGYQTGMNPETGMGNHIHVILDNQPYEAYYNLNQPFELRNVAAGRHTLRFFPSRPWHESYKNEGAFQMVTFTVAGGGDPSRPTTTNSGQVMSDNRNAANANRPANTNAGAANANAAATNTNASPAATPEGKDMQPSQAGDVDRTRPLLTYSRPKGENRGADAEAVMVDFWLANARLVGDGGEYRVRLTIDGGEPRFIDRWEPIWLSGWTTGQHTLRLELVDRNGNVAENGGYNSTERQITIVR